MQNRPGHGPTRDDKTSERMRQERESPGATTAGGHGADDAEAEQLCVPDSGPPTSSSNPHTRRGDTVNESDPAAQNVDAGRPPQEAP